MYIVGRSPTLVLVSFFLSCSFAFSNPSPQEQTIKPSTQQTSNKLEQFQQPSLRISLLRMLKLDQDARQAQIDATTEVEANVADILVSKIDNDNQAELKRIFASYGFPTLTQVGKEGVNAAFILLQHASDLELQIKMLPDIENAFRVEKSIEGQEFALLTDRILIRQGKPQIYGTQANEENGEMVFLPIENQAEVDSRRKELGMPPLAFYKRFLEKVYGLKDHPDIEL